MCDGGYSRGYYIGAKGICYNAHKEFCKPGSTTCGACKSGYVKASSDPYTKSKDPNACVVRQCPPIKPVTVQPVLGRRQVCLCPTGTVRLSRDECAAAAKLKKDYRGVPARVSSGIIGPSPPPNTKRYSSTYLTMGFAYVRAGTQKRRAQKRRAVFGYQPEHERIP